MYKRIVTIFVLLLSFAVFAPYSYSIPTTSMPSVSNDDHEYEALYVKGLGALQNHDYSSAENHFKASLKSYPNFVPAKLGLINVYFRTQQKSKAEELLLGLVETAPGDKHVQTTYANYLVYESRYAEAEAAYRKAIENSGGEVPHLIALADLYMNTPVGEVSQAISLYQQAIERDPGHAGAHYALGVAFARENQVDDALGFLDKAAQLAPGNPLPMILSGKLHARNGNLEAAGEEYRGALARDPQAIEALLGIADVQSASGDPQGAIAGYRKTAKTHPDDVRPFMRLAMEYSLLEDWQAASDAYQRVVDINPNSTLAYNNLAWIAAEHLDDTDKALEWATKATTLEPNTAAFRDTLGTVYRYRGEFDKAEQALLKALELDETYQSAHLQLGLVLIEQDRKSEAADSLNKVIELNAQNDLGKRARELLNSL